MANKAALFSSTLSILYGEDTVRMTTTRDMNIPGEKIFRLPSRDIRPLIENVELDLN